jgi:hypothetical protein
VTPEVHLPETVLSMGLPLSEEEVGLGGGVDVENPEFIADDLDPAVETGHRYLAIGLWERLADSEDSVCGCGEDHHREEEQDSPHPTHLGETRTAVAATTRSLRLLMVGRAGVVVLALATVACGPVGDTTTSTTGPPLTTAPTTTGDQTTTLPDTTTPADTTTTTIAPTIIEIASGEVEGPGVIEVDLGETVGVWVVSDIDDELHVHGYDLVFEIEAGVPLNLSFVADIPGVFEVEVHSIHAHIFDIRVVG